MDPARRKVHVVLAGKGGIGKSLAASLIAQALQHRGDAVVCLDADPVNASLHEISALKAEPISLFVEGGDETDFEALDRMFDRFLSEEAIVVVDNGAAGFVPLSNYLVQDGLVEALAERGKQLVVHTIVAGGRELVQTAKGLNSLASQFPADVPLALWLNPIHGALNNANGIPFEETPVFRSHEARIAGVIKLPLLDRMHAKSFSKLAALGLTFAEAALAEQLFVLDRSRLFRIWEPLRAQIETVL